MADTTKKVIWFSAAGILIFISLFLIFFVKSKEENAKTPNSVQTATIQAKPAPESVKGGTDPNVSETERKLAAVDLLNLPLAESDVPVRERLFKLMAHPEIRKVFNVERLISRFTASVVNVADGVNPRKNLEFLVPENGFRTEKSGERDKIARSSFDRFNFVCRIFLSLDNEELVRFYLSVEPMVKRAYTSLGHPSGNFRDTLISAIDHLLDTPVPAGDIYVRKRILSYEFETDRFEKLSDAQKLLVRTGSENQMRILLKLKSLKRLLLTIPAPDASVSN